MYEKSSSGYAINKKNIQQQQIYKIDNKILHIALIRGV